MLIPAKSGSSSQESFVSKDLNAILPWPVLFRRKNGVVRQRDEDVRGAWEEIPLTFRAD